MNGPSGPSGKSLPAERGDGVRVDATSVPRRFSTLPITTEIAASLLEDVVQRALLNKTQVASSLIFHFHTTPKTKPVVVLQWPPSDDPEAAAGASCYELAQLLLQLFTMLVHEKGKQLVNLQARDRAWVGSGVEWVGWDGGRQLVLRVYSWSFALRWAPFRHMVGAPGGVYLPPDR